MQPALFLGHGNPLNALARNAYTEAWREIGVRLPRPRGIVMISAHWYVRHTAVTLSTAPETMYDFGGFPPELYRVKYPAPGDPALAHRVKQALAPLPVDLDTSWGLDHGTWSVLLHVYPAADVPVVQLAIDARQPARFHYELGQRLAPLRDEGILVAGSGNLVHNLRAYRWNDPGAPAYDWAARFEAEARQRLLAGDHAALAAYEDLGPDARLAIPTPDHWLPLLYVLGAKHPADRVAFPVEGTEGGAISMLAVELGH